MNADFHILFYPEPYYTKTRQIGFWRDGLLLLYDLLYTRWRLYWTFWMHHFKWSRVLYNHKNFVNAKLLYWARRAIRRTLRLNYATHYRPCWDFKILYVQLVNIQLEIYCRDFCIFFFMTVIFLILVLLYYMFWQNIIYVYSTHLLRFD